ncbi:MobA-like NTP transferase domain containing protein [Profundibacterium mesophilum KAUST100406-0324]|uniref:MobA-like NTP transferase domain containing protein n=2 Tax=Profundibacterium TaxID=1258570 RepID=A0A921NUQ5_9RHOB|nr:MobA-like NTP transferase domain containing protein [Profundibacterium mesophilum KAUST100406-0324]
MRGADKLLEPVSGQALLLRTVMGARAALGAVLVTLPPPDTPRCAARRDALRGAADETGGTLEMAAVKDAQEGMAASLRLAAAWAESRLGSGSGGLLVAMADMPEIDAGAFRALRSAWDASGGTQVIRAASASGRPGQPVIFPRRLLPRLSQVTGDSGGRAILRGEDAALVPLPGDAALIDLDTPEAWAAWRAAQRP